MIKIKCIQKSDQDLLDQLVEIEKEAFGDNALSKWELVPFINHGKLFVMFKDGRPIGNLELMLDWEEPKKTYVYGLSIRKKYRNQGYGTELLKAGLYYLTDQKQIETAELTVDPDNEAAVHIYKNKLGFKKREKKNDVYGRGVDRWVMELDLEKYKKDKKEEEIQIAS